MRICLAQTNSRIADFDANLAQIEAVWARASDQGAVMLAMPELALSGYPPADLVFSPDFARAHERAFNHLLELSRRYRPQLLLGHLDFAENGDCFNAASRLHLGECLSRYHKRRLPNYGVFDEKRYFAPGASFCRFHVEGCSGTMLICEDAWDLALLRQAAAIVELIFVLNASPYERGKGAQRSAVARAARGAGLVYCNRVGAEDELVFDGNSFVLNRDGSVATSLPHCTPAFQCLEWRDHVWRVVSEVEKLPSGPYLPTWLERQLGTLPVSRLDHGLEPVPTSRFDPLLMRGTAARSVRGRANQLLGATADGSAASTTSLAPAPSLRAAFGLDPTAASGSSSNATQASAADLRLMSAASSDLNLVVESSALSAADLGQAPPPPDATPTTAFGLVSPTPEAAPAGNPFSPSKLAESKTHWGDVARDYAALVTGLQDYVHKNGGKQVVLGLSGGIDSALVLALAVDALGAKNVLTLALPSRYTSEMSMTDVALLARNFGQAQQTISIEEAMKAYHAGLSPSNGVLRELTAQNLQARLRGVYLMAVSNQYGALLLTTGNKSEIATGYCTLYGDTCGAFAPLKDVLKTDVYALAHYRNSVAPEKIPDRVLQRAPSAELAFDQKDSDSLPPYDILDPILDALLNQRLGQAQLVERGFDKALVIKVQNLIAASEFKRRQMAPGSKISKKAFGRDWRMPLTRAVFEKNL